MTRKAQRRLGRLARLQLDVDTRLLDLWASVDLVDAWSLELVAEFMRAAYAAGYNDAARGDRSLYREHGYLL